MESQTNERDFKGTNFIQITIVGLGDKTGLISYYMKDKCRTNIFRFYING